MAKFSRILLLCILMFAIPLQGMAGVLMHLGGNDHGSNMPVAQHVVSDMQHVHHCDDMPSADKNKVNAKIAGKLIDKCSSCSSCCVTVFLPPASPGKAGAAPSSEKIETIFSSCSGHIADSPERPPQA